jgi:truncated hemoglobin YjbI
VHPDDYPSTDDDRYATGELDEPISSDRIDPPYGTAGSGAHAGEARALLDDARGLRGLRRIGLLLEALTHATLATIPDQVELHADPQLPTGVLTGGFGPLADAIAADTRIRPAQDERLSDGWFEPLPGPLAILDGDPDELIAPPPYVDLNGTAVTLFDFLRHHTRNDRVWEQVVEDLYAGAAADPQVASYFHATSVEPGGDLQRHFVRALAMVTRNGLDRRTLRALHEKHAGVTDEQGRPITGEVFDKVAGVLVGAIAHRAVLDSETQRQLLALAAPIRDVLVVEPPASAFVREDVGGGNTQWG